MGISIMTN